MPPALPRVVVTRRPPADVLGPLRDVADVWMWPRDEIIPRERLLNEVSEAVAVYAMLTESVDAEFLAAAPQLAVVSNMAVGVDNIDVAECTRRGIPVGHTPDVLTETTADTAFGLLLAAARRFGEGIDYVRDGRWTTWDPELLLGADVHSSTLGVIGLGRIGRAIAQRASGFGMRMLYHSRERKPNEEAAMGLLFRDFDELLVESDHVIVCTALTADTHHLIDARALGLMKPTATLVNISRGATVDPEALLDALRSGEISAAGLDVTEPEPIPADHPLVALPNCLIIPHLGSSSRATREAMARLAVDNVVAGLAGERLPACANPEVYG
jgi:glyoxylate reductase